MKTVSTILEKRNGKVTWEKSLDFLLSLLPNGKFVLTVKKQKTQRSISQNALMWMWFACIADTTGNTKEDVHDAYCYMFLSRQVTIGGRTGRIPRGTSGLSTDEMKEFLDKVHADASSELGITLPCPEDLYFEAFEQEYLSKI
ncbi:MAG: hypothetical protein K6A93_11700 [Bacteroidaceae bacterium]|nr:hypothetical protein [Bacteroidaceae bacterium]